jgi:PIN domain nuclease of toxin-antitoxin system
VLRDDDFDVDVVVALHSLPKSFRGDPADRLIVATARAHGLTLIISVWYAA